MSDNLLWDFVRGIWYLMLIFLVIGLFCCPLIQVVDALLVGGLILFVVISWIGRVLYYIFGL